MFRISGLGESVKVNTIQLEMHIRVLFFYDIYFGDYPHYQISIQQLIDYGFMYWLNYFILKKCV